MINFLEDIFIDDELPNKAIYEAAQEAIKEYGNKKRIKIEAIAGQLETTKGYLYASLDPKQTNKPLSIDRILAITELTGDDRIIEAIAKERDLIVIRKLKGQPKIKSLSDLTDELNIKNNGVFSTVKQAIKNGELSKEEKKAIEESIYQTRKKLIELEELNKSIEPDTKDSI